ncbi:MAG: TerB family tellurite resistance protein [SAR324 cluster bacterium]|nr:TerB family tellurite resistance protein [SAR324 cluster bacterium]
MKKQEKTMEEFLGSLTPEAKRWFAKAIAGVIISDGVVDKYELEFLRQILSFLDNQEDINALLKLVKLMKSPNLGMLEIEQEKALTILKYLVQFIIIDDDFHPEEEKFFRHAVKQLGFPSNVADKFLKIADHLTKVAIQCRTKIDGNLETVRCVYISEEGCVLSMKNVVNPRTIITLEFFPPNTPPDEEPAIFYAPISGKVHRFDKKKEGIIHVKVLYNHSVSINHGVPQYYDPESYQGEVQPIATSNKSLSGIKMQCRNCRQKDIPFWTLNKGSMVTQDNIFGTTVYTEAHEGFDVCDYNRIQVMVCPNCFFASTLDSLFHRQGTWPFPLTYDLDLFTRQWDAGFGRRQEDIKNPGTPPWMLQETRTEEQALLAFDRAIETHDILSGCDSENDNVFHQILIGVYLMIQAEIFMEMEKPLDADRRLAQVIRRLTPLFASMNPVMQIRMARSLGMIHLYRMEDNKFNRYKQFLDTASQSSKFKPNSSGDRTLKASLETMEHANQNKTEYQKGNRSNFLREKKTK